MKVTFIYIIRQHSVDPQAKPEHLETRNLLCNVL